MAIRLKKILLIEDSQTDSFLIQRAMRENPTLTSHTLVIQENMKAAQDYLEVHRDSISLILLDLGLPDTTDGRDSYEQISIVNSTDIPVIALTSAANRNMSIALAELGLEDFLYKGDVMYAPLLLTQSIDFVLSKNIRRSRSVRDMMCDIDSYAGIIGFPNA